jgi:hypothetical protein
MNRARARARSFRSFADETLRRLSAGEVTAATVERHLFEHIDKVSARESLRTARRRGARLQVDAALALDQADKGQRGVADLVLATLNEAKLRAPLYHPQRLFSVQFLCPPLLK